MNLKYDKIKMRFADVFKKFKTCIIDFMRKENIPNLNSEKLAFLFQ